MAGLSLELLKLRAARSVDDLTRRYRALCKRYHPDLKAVGDRPRYQRHMQQINEAYTETMARFNIVTFRKPDQPKSDPLIDVDFVARCTEPKPPPKREEQPKSAKLDQSFINAEAARELGRALAVLKDSRVFLSLKGTRDDKERAVFRKAMQHLERTWQRYPQTREGQDALYYIAVAHCNLMNYHTALEKFEQYREAFPGDKRSHLFSFYCGLLYHRLGQFALAASEYISYLEGKPQRQFQHFTGTQQRSKFDFLLSHDALGSGDCFTQQIRLPAFYDDGFEDHGLDCRVVGDSLTTR